MTDLEIIVAEIMSIDGCPVTKSRAVAVLRSKTGQRILFAKGVLMHKDQLALASDLLSRMPRNAVRDALMTRLRVSRDTAYRIIRQALMTPRQGKL